MKKFKKKDGITLIALVVTIIVLLILAGVTIATLTGENGILSQAQVSKDSTERAEEKERIQLEVLGSYETDGILSISNLKSNILAHIEGATHDDANNFPLTVTYTATGHAYTIDDFGNVQKKLAQLVTGEPTVTLADGTNIPQEGAATDAKLKIEFTASIENGTVESVTPGEYDSNTKKVTHVTTNDEVNSQIVEFTFVCESEGQRLAPDPTKTVNLENYYKIGFNAEEVKNSAKSFYGKVVKNYSPPEPYDNQTHSWVVFYADSQSDRIYLVSSRGLSSLPNGTGLNRAQPVRCSLGKCSRVTNGEHSEKSFGCFGFIQVY